MPGQLFRRTWLSNPTLHAPAKHKRACRYDAFVPVELKTLGLQLDAGLSGLISQTEQELQQLNGEAGGVLNPLARLLLRTESIASSKVEGMQVGIQELARAEAKAESGGTPGSTAMDVLANINAMELAVDNAAALEQFGEPDLLAIHRQLLEHEVHRQIAGQIRTTQNWIGGNDYTPCGADFVPPPPEDVHRLLADLYVAINDTLLPPLVQAALVHAQFETIHPFDDGNGRTGRALVHVVLRRRGIAPRFLPPISVVFAGARDRYINGLTQFRGDGVALWIEQFATATLAAVHHARAYIDATRALQEAWRERLRAHAIVPRADAAAWPIIDVLPAHPMISGPVAEAATGRSRARVNEAITMLVDAGVLISTTTGRRNRWWQASGLLALIERFENGIG